MPSVFFPNNPCWGLRVCVGCDMFLFMGLFDSRFVKKMFFFYIPHGISGHFNCFKIKHTRPLFFRWWMITRVFFFGCFFFFFYFWDPTQTLRLLFFLFGCKLNEKKSRNVAKQTIIKWVFGFEHGFWFYYLRENFN